MDGDIDQSALPEHWAGPDHGVYCAISEGRPRPGTVVETLYRSRWRGIRLITNVNRAHMVARRRQLDVVYAIAHDDRCLRPEHIDLEAVPLATIIRRWAGLGIDLLWADSPAQAGRVLHSCRQEGLPAHIVVETPQDVPSGEAIPDHLQAAYAISDGATNHLCHYRLKQAPRRLRRRLSDNPVPADTAVSADQMVLVEQTLWAKHEHLQRLRWRPRLARLVARQFGSGT